MDITSQTKASVEELNAILGGLSDAYGWLSQKYYLPSITSKAIRKEYLMKIMLANERVLRVPRTITRNYIEYRGNTIGEMLEKLEGFLRDEGHPPSGLTPLHLPDYNWLYDVCSWIDPTNKMRILKYTPPSKSTITRTINQEYDSFRNFF